MKGGEDHVQHQEHILKILRNIRSVYFIDETACDVPKLISLIISYVPDGADVYSAITLFISAKFRARYCSVQFKWDLFLISYFHTVIFF